MPSALVPLANLTLGSAQASVTFSSIVGSYRDLYLVIDASGGTAGNNLFCAVNADTSTGNYNYVWMFSNGSSATCSSGNHYYLSYDGAITTAHFMDYSATDKHKTFIARNDIAASRVRAIANRWANTSAITSLVLSTSGSSFAAGTTFALYGVSA